MVTKIGVIVKNCFLTTKVVILDKIRKKSTLVLIGRREVLLFIQMLFL